MRYIMILLVLMLVMVAGCYHPRAVLVNDKEKNIMCEANGCGLFFVLFAKGSFDNCVIKAEEQGFKVKERWNQ